MRSLGWGWLLALGVVGADQASKAWVRGHLVPGQVVRVTDWFNWVLAFNQGAAFSFLASSGGWQKGLFSAIAVLAVIVLSILIWRHAAERWFCTGLALIMGGALGNLVDRLVAGEVTDFVQWHVGQHYWPAFNGADSAITLGVVMLLLEGQGKRASAKSGEKPGGPLA
ncbi:MAG: signal peptidase II [Ferrovum sp.]|jgi:signal peptidase II|uniref:signal peptidase II n=1 Tax=Ferrovum sp. TaxID=2609467 RepID=UPI002639F1D3|nr:signal peptidase II [Ferrovum sp.]MBW8066284.1 signal peptidase II [Ferrovum sp.]